MQTLAIPAGLTHSAATLATDSHSIMENDPWLQEYIRTHPLGGQSESHYKYADDATVSLLALAVLFVIAGFRFRRSFLVYWIDLPSHVRRGLLRIYVVICTPWIAWFGYRLFDNANHARRILETLWWLIFAPIGGPILFFIVLWVIKGFRKPQLGEEIPASASGHDPIQLADLSEHYTRLITRAISHLPHNSLWSRRSVYQKVSGTLGGLLKDDTIELRHQKNVLDKVIDKIEAEQVVQDRNVKRFAPASTALLVIAMMLPGLWAMDVTSMSLYWVARISGIAPHGK